MGDRAVRKDLRGFVQALELEAAGELRRINVPKSIAEARDHRDRRTRRASRRAGAVVRAGPRAPRMPLLINPLGTARRIEIALGRSPESIGAMLLDLAQRAQPAASEGRVGGALGSSRCCRCARGACATRRCRRSRKNPTCSASCRCRRLLAGRRRSVHHFRRGDHPRPAHWRAQHRAVPVPGVRRPTTGMHWQIVRGCGNHYARAESLGPAAGDRGVVGADPALLLSAIAALPGGHGRDRLLRNPGRRQPCPMVKAKTLSMEVPANAEMVLEGTVAPGERRMEGPFGDHFGHYSHAAPYPVFRVQKVTRREDPIYLSAVVGLPPQEDKYIGNATQEILGPLIKVIHPRDRARCGRTSRPDSTTCWWCRCGSASTRRRSRPRWR